MVLGRVRHEAVDGHVSFLESGNALIEAVIMVLSAFDINVTFVARGMSRASKKI
jgi:hypothetical protein